MSMHRQTYIGCYLLAKLPTITERQYYGECPDCKRTTRYDTSPCHGQPVFFPMRDRMMSLYEFLEREWGKANAEIFYSADEYEPDGWVVVLGNRRDLLYYTFINLPDETEAVKPEIPMPQGTFIGDWQRLIDTFAERGIEYQKKYGIVTYWS